MKNKFNKQLKGFTLIELLVVITIIGILATIVVVNLNSARGKGQDTAIKEQMAQFRAQAALFYDDYYGYANSNTNSALTGICPTVAASSNVFTTADFIRVYNALKRNAGNTPNCYLEAGNGSTPGQKWALTTPLRLPTSSGGKWCVDSIGNSLEITGTPTSEQCQ